MHVITLSQALSATFGVASGATAAVAACYWWKSLQVPMPTALHGFSPMGGATHVNTNPLVKAASEAGRLNAIAASWSAIAAACACVSSLSGFVSSF